jgi:hypothetical protein
MKFLSNLIILLSSISLCLAQTTTTDLSGCRNAYNITIDKKFKDVKYLQKFIDSGEGISAVKAVGLALGASSVTAIAGAGIGFVLPYAITGVTYSLMGVGTAATAVVTTIPGLSGGAVVGGAYAAIDGDSAAIPIAALLGGVVGGAVKLGLSSTYGMSGTQALWQMSLVPAAKGMMGAASNVASAVIPLAGSYFLPIGASVGAVVGFSLVFKDLLLGVQMKKLAKSNKLIDSAYRYVEGGSKAEFYNYLKKIIKKNKDLTKENADEIAEMVIALDQSKSFCRDGKPLAFRKLKKAIKDEIKASFLAVKETGDNSVSSSKKLSTDESSRDIINKLNTENLNQDSSEKTKKTPGVGVGAQ